VLVVLSIDGFKKGHLLKYSKELLLLKLSVSSMGTFDKCPKKYHYRYIEKPDVPRVKHNFTEFGSCAHLMLEMFHEYIMSHGPVDEKDYPALMKKCFKDSIKKFDFYLLNTKTWSPDGDKDGIVYLREIMQSYLDHIRDDGMPEVIGVEVPYSFEIEEGVTVRGYIDRLDRISEGEYHVVDYKTSKSLKYMTSFQLLVYAEAIKRLYPDATVIHGSYLMLKHNCKYLDWTFNANDLKKCRSKIVKTASNIQTETHWVKKPSILCQWCDYESICQGSWVEGE